MANRDVEDLDQVTKDDPKSPKNIRKKIDLAAIIADMDHTNLILALIAANPDLDDILPDDPNLRNDVTDIRQKIAEQRLRFSENAGEINTIVERHVHVHLWDEKTSERLKALGASVAALFKQAMEKLVEAKTQLIDNDSRETISVDEAYDGFKSSFRGMVDFIKGDIPVGKIGMMLIGALPPENKEAALRVASSAVDDVLDAELEPVSDPIVFHDDDALFQDDALYEDDAPVQDTPPINTDETLYVVRSTTPSSPHYITDLPGADTYVKAEAARFGQEEAQQRAEDLSDYAATKGFGYRYQIEDAAVSKGYQLGSAIRLN